MTAEQEGGSERAAAPYAEDTLGGFLDRVAAREPAPGGGSVAAVTVSIAAALVEMTARFSADGRSQADARSAADARSPEDPLPPASQLVYDVRQIRRRAAELADLDAAVYGEVLAAYARRGDQEPARRREDIRAALHRASEVPLEVADLGAQTATLAAHLVAVGNRSLRGDAATALFLADAAVRSAAHLVTLNIEAGGGDPGLVTRAERSVDVSGALVRRLRSSEEGG